MAMRLGTWAWFSLRARVPWGAPCIFGSIQQARVAAYAPDIPYWSQERLQRAVLVGGQTPLGQMGVLRAVPEPKMTSISVTLLSRSGTGRARGAEYSVFLHGPGGGTSGPERTSQLFYAICNWKYAKHHEVSLLMSKLNARSSTSTPRPNPTEQGRTWRILTETQTRLERHPKISCPSRVKR